MCGIAGFTHPGEDPAEVRDRLARMRHAIVHRGPDDEGEYVDPAVALGMRRLSIIDLSGGHQPLANEDGTVWVTFNGEIYNFAELRRWCEERGHRFATHSDTEVLVHLYEEEGGELVHRLNGDFAFAIWDRPRRRLLLARDRLGIKPLYYAHDGPRLAWGSEIKCLLALPWVRRDLDPVALDQFLTYRYVHHPRTPFAAVRKLPPGHRARFEDGRLTVERWWSAPLGPTLPRAGSDLEELRALLTDSVQRRLVADVEVGAFLSGGLDSSLMTAVMRGQGAVSRVRTFSIAFEEQTRVNEAPFAARVAKALGTEHLEFLVRARSAELLPRLVWHLDDPLADPAVLPTFQLSVLARKHITVALSGEGADELFAGYPKYRLDRWVRLLRLASGPLRRPLIALGRRLGGGVSAEAWDLVDRPDVARWLEWDQVLRRDRRRALYGERLRLACERDEVEAFAELERATAADPLTRMQWLDLQQWLPEDLLMKADKMSMAASLEVRVPYLDHRVVEWALRHDPGLRLAGREHKWALRQLAARLLAPEIAGRRKHGFAVPIAEWIRNELQPAARHLLADSRLAASGWLRPAALQALLDEHLDRRANHGPRLWNLMVLELWYRIHGLGEADAEIQADVWR